jgi:hypothetical protein
MPKQPSSKRTEPEKMDPKTGEEKDEEVYKKEKDYWLEREKKRKVEEPIYAQAIKVTEDGPQWLWYWVFYILVNGMRGPVSVYLPGWKGWYELWRSVVLVIVSGPWQSKAALVQ